MCRSFSASYSFPFGTGICFGDMLLSKLRYGICFGSDVIEWFEGADS